MYEGSIGLVMAHRRKRLSLKNVSEIVASLKSPPIVIDPPDFQSTLDLPALALKYHLTAYDAAYLELTLRLKLPIATKDEALKRAMASCHIQVVQP